MIAFSFASGCQRQFGPGAQLSEANEGCRNMAHAAMIVALARPSVAVSVRRGAQLLDWPGGTGVPRPADRFCAVEAYRLSFGTRGAACRLDRRASRARTTRFTTWREK